MNRTLTPAAAALWCLLAAAAFGGQPVIKAPLGPVEANKRVGLRVTGEPDFRAAVLSGDATVHPGVLDDGTPLIWFLATVPGSYQIVAIGPDWLAGQVVVQVGEPQPDPKPDPKPDPPPPPPGPRFVLVIHESSDRTPQLAVAMNGLRAYLEEKKHPHRFEDDDLKAEWIKPYLEAIAKAEIALPALVVDEDGDPLHGFAAVHVEAFPNLGVDENGNMLYDAAEAIKVVQKYEGAESSPVPATELKAPSSRPTVPRSSPPHR